MSKARNESYIKKFGAHLRKQRKDNKLTMNMIASKARMELNSIYRIEKGKVDISICTLATIAKALETSPSKLLDF